MNEELSEFILSNIEKPFFIERWCGVVKAVTKKEKVLPVGHVLSGPDCVRSADVMEIIPNSKLKGILYFEDKGIASTSNTTTAFGFRSELRLVCWLNNPLHKQNNLSSLAITDIMQKLNKTFPTKKGVFVMVRPRVNGIAIQDATIFGKYDYDDTTSGYLQGNYEYFALDLSVTFYVPKACNLAII